MNELRELALGRGWRKLVADGVAASPVELRRGPAVKIVDGVRTETVPLDRWPDRLDALLDDARHVHLHAPGGDIHARRTRRGRWLVSHGRPSSAGGVETRHDREKQHPLPATHPLFATTHSSPAKRRQVQHYVELVRVLPLWQRDRVRVLDAGCGKAYLSLALVAYGRETGTAVDLVGLDVNPAVVATVREIANGLGYDEARFEATSIAEYESDEPVDLLVSLHACDTATDEAIAAGVRLQAEAVVVAPCCHHELAAQIAARETDALLRHGLLLGRQADLVTDALRAAALESVGYRVDVIEFVSAEHTAKNLLLRAVRSPSPGREQRALEQYRELRDRYGVDPAIGRLLGGPLTLE
ncbi:MAG TPA: SAM-dependent methyltransferase [Gaiellaceae bacterium]|nr:SAM-dependent methyltransferase [Gaiellaceae bacterium]